ncbi:MAG: serine/threonine-protein phosphatase [Lachnospiraceae bacterium]|nr:serine/threonine-protein phosphatase [Lachnospiraceae bacterium]
MKDEIRRKISKENQILELAILSVIGDRSEQQDNFGYEITDRECMVTVCDGMGGHRGGRLASSLAVKHMMDTYRNCYAEKDIISFLHDTTVEADRIVSELKDGEGNKLNAGSTLVSIIIKNNELYWSSVGDSRLYLVRGNEIVQVTLDHNYHEYLNEILYNNQISEEEYEKENQKGEALINYLGVGGLKVIDHNEGPLHLFQGDKLLVMSDGLYKLVEDKSIYNLVNNFGNINEAVESMDLKAEKIARKNKISRDNMTVALIKIK